MKGINKVILLGTVGNVPELRYTVHQHAIGTFPLATHRHVINVDGEREEKTDWHHMVMFGRMAEYFATCLQKGSKIYVDGVLEYHEVPHATYKDVLLHKTSVEVKRIEVIDGMVLHPYPEDFPPLSYSNSHSSSYPGKKTTTPKTSRKQPDNKPVDNKNTIDKQDFSDDLFD